MQTYAQWQAEYEASGMADCHSLCEIEAVPHPPQIHHAYDNALTAFLLVAIGIGIAAGMVREHRETGRWWPAGDRINE